MEFYFVMIRAEKTIGRNLTLIRKKFGLQPYDYFPGHKKLEDFEKQIEENLPEGDVNYYKTR
jgi:hypothetical protein